MEAGDHEKGRYLTYPWQNNTWLHTRGHGVRSKMQLRGLKSTHINEELMFVFFVCSDESAFRLNVAVAGKTLDSRQIE